MALKQTTFHTLMLLLMIPLATAQSLQLVYISRSGRQPGDNRITLECRRDGVAVASPQIFVERSDLARQPSISLCYPLYEYGHQEHCCFISIYMHIALHGVLCISMGIRNTVVLLVSTARCTLHKYGHQDVLVSRARLSRGESESLACETKNVGICMMKYFRYL